MTLVYKDVFNLIAVAVPEFIATDDDRSEASPYFFLSDMVGFLCERVARGSAVGLPEFGALLEQMAANGDTDVRDLLVDVLEGLRESGSSTVIASHFGPRTQGLWAQVSKNG